MTSGNTQFLQAVQGDVIKRLAWDAVKRKSKMQELLPKCWEMRGKSRMRCFPMPTMVYLTLNLRSLRLFQPRIQGSLSQPNWPKSIKIWNDQNVIFITLSLWHFRNSPQEGIVIYWDTVWGCQIIAAVVLWWKLATCVLWSCAPLMNFKKTSSITILNDINQIQLVFK